MKLQERFLHLKLDYIILITRDRLEEYDLNHERKKTILLDETHFAKKIARIKELLRRYSYNQKKLVFIEEPISFYKEYSKQSSHFIFDEDIEKYSRKKIKSFSKNKISYKYFYTGILDILKPDEIVDVYELLENEIDKDSLIVRESSSKGEFLIFKKGYFSKVTYVEVLEKVRNSYEKIVLYEPVSYDKDIFDIPSVIFKYGITVERIISYLHYRPKKNYIKVIRNRYIFKKIFKIIFSIIFLIISFDLIMLITEEKSISKILYDKYCYKVEIDKAILEKAKVLEFSDGKIKIKY